MHNDNKNIQAKLFTVTTAAASTTETPPHMEVMDLPPTISILLTPGGTVATAAEDLLQTTRTKEDTEYEYNSLTLDEMDDIKDLEGGDYLNDATWESLDTELVKQDRVDSQIMTEPNPSSENYF